MIEINCHMCGESYAAYITLGRGETRMQPAEPDTVDPEECPHCGEDADAGLAVELHRARCDHEREEAADAARKRVNEYKGMIMDYATWEKHRDALANKTWTAWAKWPADVQDAMRMIDPEYREFLRYDAAWQNAQGTPFLPGNVYRVTPAWPGPAKPVPVAEYEDCMVECITDWHNYMFARDGEFPRSIVLAPADPRFVGYVMADGKLRPRLLFDYQPDGTCRLRVPLAVRLRKEVAK